MFLDSIVLDIVFFGESLPSAFYHNLDEDSEKVYAFMILDSLVSNNYAESSLGWGKSFGFYRPDMIVYLTFDQ